VDDVVLFNVVQRNQDLDSEASDEALGHAFEVIHFYEFIEVHGHNFKGQDQMFAEHQGFLNPHDVLLIVWVAVPEALEDTSFDETLFIEALLVAEDFEGDELLSLVVPTFENLAEGALANTFVNFKSVSNVVVDVTNVLSFVVIKTTVFWSVRCLKFSSLSF